MLKNPKKNFGIIPTGNFLAGVILVMAFLVIPFILTSIKAITGAEIGTLEAFTTGARLIFLILYASILWKKDKDSLGIYDISKRTRYVQKTLIPFLNRKYGVKINAKSQQTLTRVALGGHIEAQKDNTLLDDLHFMGWEEIEKIASTGEKNDELGNLVYLVTDHDEDGSLREIFPVGFKDGDQLTVYRSPQNIPTLAETETGVKNMVFDIISSLPVSETVIRCIAPSSNELPSVDAELRVSVDPGGAVSYSNEELKNIIESTVFNVRMSDTGMVVCLINTPDGKTYVSGRLVSNESYSDVAAESLRHMAKAEDTESMIFLDDLKSIH